METEEETRYLSEPVFRMILEKSEVLSSYLVYEVGSVKTGYLVLTGKGVIREMVEFYGRDHTSNRHISSILPEAAIAKFDLTLAGIEKMSAKAKKIFLDAIEKEIAKVEGE